MTDSLADLLGKRSFEEPPEIAIIKDFVAAKYQVVPTVSVNERQIIIGVPSAGLAGALRPELLQIKSLCNTEKRLVIRIQ